MSGSRPKGSKGFTLIEVLVALVILSVGMLGLLGMRVAGLKNAANANARAAAALQAADMMDRLRANPLRAAAGSYNIGLDEPAPVGSTEIADQDVAQWRLALSSNLSQGTGSVAVDIDGGATITVRWTERQSEVSQGASYLFTFQSRL